MDITIIGTGNMARGIATRALEGGRPRSSTRTDSAVERRIPGSNTADELCRNEFGGDAKV